MEEELFKAKTALAMTQSFLMTTLMKFEETWKEIEEKKVNWYQVLMVTSKLKEVENEVDHTKTKLQRLETEKTLEQYQHKTTVKSLKVTIMSLPKESKETKEKEKL